MRLPYLLDEYLENIDLVISCPTDAQLVDIISENVRFIRDIKWLLLDEYATDRCTYCENDAKLLLRNMFLLQDNFNKAHNYDYSGDLEGSCLTIFLLLYF